MVQSFYMAFENSEEWEHSADWGVYCARYRFPDATIKENKVNVVGSNGVIDLSSELTGDVVFNNVQGEIDFIILRDSDFDYSAFKNKYHGKRVKVMPDNDNEHYRIGRLSIKEDNNQDVLKRVYMVLDADPFRYNVEETTKTFEVLYPQSIQIGYTAPQETYKYNHTIGENYIIFNCNDEGASKYGDYYRKKLNLSTIFTWGELDTESFNLELTPNTNYYVSADFYFAHRSESADDSKGFFWDTSSYKDTSMFFGIKLADGTTLKEIKSFAAQSTHRVSAFFNSGQNNQLKIICAGVLSKITTFSSLSEVLKVENIMLVKTEQDVDLKNNGRKQIVPEISATVDCTAVINGNVSQISANEKKKNFDLVLDETNKVVFFGDEEGEALVKYREAVL